MWKTKMSSFLISSLRVILVAMCSVTIMIASIGIFQEISFISRTNRKEVSLPIYSLVFFTVVVLIVHLLGCYGGISADPTYLRWVT